MTPENKERMRLNLIDYITGTVDEWLRLAHFDQTPEDRDGIQLRISWEHHEEGVMIAHVKELDHTEVARFGVSVDVQALEDLPPIGPENDPAMIQEAHHLKVSAVHEPANSHAVIQSVEESYRSEVLNHKWVEATFLMCLAGDRIRMAGQETDVLRSSSGVWHANNGDAWHPTPWVHTELRMDLAANPGFQEYPPQTPCEILMSPERYAVHLLMQTFPGSQIVS